MFKVKLPMFLNKAYQIKKEFNELESKNNSFSQTQLHKKENSLNLAETSREEIEKIGYEKGYQEGKEKEREKIREIIAILQKIVKDLEIKKEIIVDEMEQKTVEIAMATARKIIKKEIDQDPQVILRTVREALKRIKQAQKITIKVNPLDWTTLKKVQPELLFSSLEKKNIYIEKDETITRGGSLIETDKEIIDARLEQQIYKVNKALLGEEN